MFSALITSQFALCMFFITPSPYQWRLYHLGSFRFLQNFAKPIIQINYNLGTFVLFTINLFNIFGHRTVFLLENICFRSAAFLV